MYTKILCTILSLTVIGSTVPIVNAQDETDINKINEKQENVSVYTEDLSEFGYSDFVLRYNKSNVTQTINNSETNAKIEIDFNKDGRHGHFERIEDTGYYFEDNILISTIEYNTPILRASISSSIMNLGFAPDSGFSNFYYSGQEGWVARAVEGLATDVAVNVILTAISGGLPYYIIGAIRNAYSSASDLYTICTLNDLFSDTNLRAVDIFYGSYNGECGILAWYGYKTYALKAALSNDIDYRTGSSFHQNESYTWNGSPWDYTQPSGCRLVVNQYPY